MCKQKKNETTKKKDRTYHRCIKVNLQTELLQYCKSDVDILAKACLSFRKLFMEITKKDSNDTGVDPFTQCITLPSAVNWLVTTKWLFRRT